MMPVWPVGRKVRRQLPGLQSSWGKAQRGCQELQVSTEHAAWAPHLSGGARGKHVSHANPAWFQQLCSLVANCILMAATFPHLNEIPITLLQLEQGLSNFNTWEPSMKGSERYILNSKVQGSEKNIPFKFLFMFYIVQHKNKIPI